MRLRLPRVSPLLEELHYFTNKASLLILLILRTFSRGYRLVTLIFSLENFLFKNYFSFLSPPFFHSISAIFVRNTKIRKRETRVDYICIDTAGFPEIKEQTTSNRCVVDSKQSRRTIAVRYY